MNAFPLVADPIDGIGHVSQQHQPLVVRQHVEKAQGFGPGAEALGDGANHPCLGLGGNHRIGQGVAQLLALPHQIGHHPHLAAHSGEGAVVLDGVGQSLGIALGYETGVLHLRSASRPWRWSCRRSPTHPAHPGRGCQNKGIPEDLGPPGVGTLAALAPRAAQEGRMVAMPPRSVNPNPKNSAG